MEKSSTKAGALRGTRDGRKVSARDELGIRLEIVCGHTIWEPRITPYRLPEKHLTGTINDPK